LGGSSYLNERFQRLLEQRLEKETYLESEMTNITKTGLIESQVYEFENEKRRLDITKETTVGIEVYIPGLKPCKEKKFRKNRLILDR
jgi:hypothetical protein